LPGAGVKPDRVNPPMENPATEDRCNPGRYSRIRLPRRLSRWWPRRELATGCAKRGPLEFVPLTRSSTGSDRGGLPHFGRNSLAGRRYLLADALDSSASVKQSVPGGSWTPPAYQHESCPCPEGFFPVPNLRTSSAAK